MYVPFINFNCTMNALIIPWACKELSKMLKTEVSEDLVSYMLMIDEEGEVRTYVYDLVGLGSKNELVENFIVNLLNKKNTQLEDVSVYQKSKLENMESKNEKNKSKKNQFKNKNILADLHAANFRKTPLDVTHIPEIDPLEQDVPKTSPKKQKKTQYVSLYSKEGENKTNAVMIPGRHPCECQAQKHKYVQ